jgi:hypothetical protein
VTAQTELIAPQAKTADIIDALRRLHPTHEGQWCFIDELRLGVGYSKATCEQRIDAFATHCWTPYERVAYEVKASRSDFLREMKKPRKRARGLLLSNEFFFAAPAGLIKPEEVPPECGLYEVSWGSWEVTRYLVSEDREEHTGHWDSRWEAVRKEGFVAKVKVPAPFRDSYPPTWNFVAAVMRRMQKAVPE